MRFRAVSAHAPVLRLLRRHRRAVVLGAHPRAVNLRLGGAVVTLVAAERGNGPGALVLAAGQLPGQLAWRPGEPVEVGAGWLRGAAGTAVWWAGSSPWRPPRCAPAGRDLAAAAREGLAWLSGRLSAVAARGALLPAVLACLWPRGDAQAARGGARGDFARALREEAVARIRRLRAALAGAAGPGSPAAAAPVRGDPPGGLHAAVAGLVGFGPGLTPSGDDLLAGLACTLRRARHPASAALAAALRRGWAARRTHLLSGHFLRWAARGVAAECGVALVDALLAGRPGAEADAALARVVAAGSWSGPDWAAGVLLALDLLGRAGADCP